MVTSFKNKGTEDIFNGRNTKDARKTCPQSLWKIASRKLDRLDSVSNLEDLKMPPGNMFEPLKGSRKGLYSIRINDQYKICCQWSESAPYFVKIIDYH